MRVQIFTSGQTASLTRFSPKEGIMSVEIAIAFVEKMRKDLEFKKRIQAAGSAAKRKELIKSAGFDFERMHLDSLVSELTLEERDALMLF
jgi:predicted ribosomally synthesized peptide with nif11-like leader